MKPIQQLITLLFTAIMLVSCDAQDAKKPEPPASPPSAAAPAPTPQADKWTQRERTKLGQISAGAFKLLPGDFLQPAELAFAPGVEGVIGLEWPEYQRGGGSKGLILYHADKPLPKNQDFILFATATLIEGGVSLIPNNALLGLLIEEAEGGKYKIIKVGRLKTSQTGFGPSGEAILAERAEVILNGESGEVITRGRFK